ncbi:MAG: hypothetical protein ABS918_01705 [Saccharopolyspora rectivirgula]
MRGTASIAGVLATSTGMLISAPVAFADSASNDGINIGNDNNIVVAPIQACGNTIAAVIGAVIPIGSPQDVNCVNDPVAEDPEVEVPAPEPKPLPDPEPQPEPEPDPKLPEAPAPEIIPGHHPVTG